MSVLVHESECLAACLVMPMCPAVVTAGAEVFVSQDDNCTKHPMYHIACTPFDCSELIASLQRSCPLLKYHIKQMNKAEQLQWSLLHTTASHGNSHNMKAFFELGMRMGPRLCDTLYSPLHCAILRDQPDLDMLALLLSHCGYDDIVAVDYRGRSPIFLACLMGHLDAVMHLAEAGNDAIAIRNVSGNTCLHAACQSGNRHLMRWLLSEYPQLNTGNENGSMPDDFVEESRRGVWMKDDVSEQQLLREAFKTGDVRALESFQVRV